MFKNRFAAIAAILITGLMLLGLAGSPSPAKAAVDSWSGHTENVVPFSASVTLNAAPALICTAVTGKTLNIRAITITDSASGVVEIYNGSGGAGSTVLMSVGLIANTPLTLTEDMLGQGLRTTSGTGLYVSGATGTISLTMRVRQDF